MRPMEQVARDAGSMISTKKAIGEGPRRVDRLQMLLALSQSSRHAKAKGSPSLAALGRSYALSGGFQYPLLKLPLVTVFTDGVNQASFVFLSAVYCLA